MADMNHVSQSPDVLAYSQWLAEIEQQPNFDDIPPFEPLEPEELERLEEAGRDYAQELFEQGAIPELGDIDLDERFLESEPAVDREIDLDFDH